MSKFEASTKNSIEPLERALQQLRRSSALFRPPLYRMILGLLLGILFTLGGIAILIADLQADSDRNRKIMGIVAGLIPLTLGIIALVYVRYTNKFRVFVCAGGLVIVRSS